MLESLLEVMQWVHKLAQSYHPHLLWESILLKAVEKALVTSNCVFTPSSYQS